MQYICTIVIEENTGFRDADNDIEYMKNQNTSSINISVYIF